jgi:hypothetical protein
VIIWWCDLQLHMSYITEIQGAILDVIIWFCDLQLHMSYSNEIQEAVVDICSCKSHHHMITITTAPCISVIHDFLYSKNFMRGLEK